jgi:RNA polymerase sigma-70 factor (ECF subfamily)
VNDREWIHEALRRHEAPLISYAAKVCGDQDRARDAVQETFLELCSADRRAIEGTLAAWLYRVCRNKALDLRRKEHVMRTAEDITSRERPGPEPEPAALITRGEDRAQVLALLARLPEKQQEVLRLKFQGGLSYQEIATVTGTTVGNVGFLIHVALKSMRERLSVAGRLAS